MTVSRAALAVAAAVVAAHVATIGNYGYFGDELYFIDCARHLAWGYVDLPPFVALICWAASPLDDPLWAIRILPALAAGGTVIAAAAVARELGGRGFAQLLTAICVALAPTDLLYGSFLSTSSFEPLAWTLLVYLTLRLAATREPRIFVAIAALVTAALYMKYSIAMCAIALLIALIVAGRARLFASPWFFGALAGCALLVLPNVAWQFAHGLPFLEVVKTDALDRHPLGNGVAFESSNLALNAALFAAMQLLYLNPILAFIWLWGLGRLAFARDAAPHRFLAIAYVVLFAFMVAGNARGYYMSAFYASLFAAGGVAVEAATANRTAWRVAVAAIAAAGGVALAPFAIPVLPVDTFVAYTSALGVSKPAPPDGAPHLIQPLYAEEFGWEAMTATVAGVYKSLPAAQRADTPVFTDGYTYAGAFDFYGPRFGLPPVLSANNNYYLWGYGDYDGKQMIAVGGSYYPLYTRLYGSVKQVAVYRDVHRWMIEGPLPIYLCTQPKMPLAQMWPLLKKFGL